MIRLKGFNKRGCGTNCLGENCRKLRCCKNNFIRSTAAPARGCCGEYSREKTLGGVLQK